jgi:hypothetical protein
MAELGAKVLTMWTIYKRPRDAPQHYVVRASQIRTGIPEPLVALVGCLCDSLAEARATIPRGLICLARQADDDPVIVETWL